MDSDNTFDSSKNTLTHIRKVNENIIKFCQEMLQRAMVHDQSKLEEFEKPLIDEHSQELYSHVYGSPGYMKVLDKMRPAIAHHEANNTHHVEHYSNGIEGLRCIVIGKLHLKR